jgi:hydrogenase maturation protease
MTAGGRGPLVIGLGSPDRGDDTVGAAVARVVASRHPGLEVLEHEDPLGLLDLWTGHDPVVLVDAVRSGAAPGTVHWIETGSGGPPVSRRRWAFGGHGSTHAIGLAEMVELARALGRLPERMLVVGVEAAGFEHGASLSPEVVAAVPRAADLVGEALLLADETEDSDVPR